jgi:hypothetical protein
MKIIKIATTTIMILFICMGQVNAKPGNGDAGGKPKSGSDGVDGAACETSQDFPSMIYTRVKESKGGKREGYDMFLSNRDGSCSILIFTSKHKGGLYPSYKQNGSEGIVVWMQSKDENARKRVPDVPLVRMLRFNITNQVIGDVLPLLATTAYQRPENSAEGFTHLISLSNDGNTALFASEERALDGVTFFNYLNEINIKNCLANCSMSKISLSLDGYHTALDYGSFGDRVYYALHLSSPGTSRDAIQFIEKNGVTWSEPRTVLVDDASRYNASNDVVFPWLSVAIYRNREVIAFNIRDYTTGTDGIEVVDVTDCIVPGTDSCLLTGESSIVFDNISGKLPSFSSGLDPNLLYSSNGSIFEYDLDADNILGNLVDNAFMADSAD